MSLATSDVAGVDPLAVSLEERLEPEEIRRGMSDQPR